MKSRCRPFSLADGMILVAAAAVGVWGLPDSWRYAWEDLMKNGPNPYLGTLRAACGHLLSTWCAATLALLLIRLRRPRPPWREVIVQPGCAAGLVIAASFGLIWLFNLIVIGSRQYPISFSDSMVFLSERGPAAILACWITLRVVGRWEPEPGWIDRTGRILGWGWIALQFVFSLTGSLDLL